MTAVVLPNDFRSQWQSISDDAMRAFARVGESGWLVLGAETRAFEEAVAPLFGVQHAVGTGNGLDALEIALRAAGVTVGQKVLTTPLSAFATTLAVVRAGCVPVFVDVDETGLLDLDATAERLAEGDVHAMLPVHLYGHAHDLERLDALARKHDVVLVEDCAQSILATSRGAAAGSIGTLAATSFYPTKNLGCYGDGGAVLARDGVLADACRKLRDYGQSEKYVHAELGLNSRLDELQAGLLRSAMLPRLRAWTERRRAIAARYLEGIAHASIALPSVPEGSDSVWHLFPVLTSVRDAFIAHLESRGVRAGVHYPRLISEQSALRGVAFEARASMPVARRFTEMEVSLPIHPFMDDADVAKVIDACNAWRGP